MKCTCILNCTYIWSKSIHSWDIRVVFLVFDSIATIMLKLWNGRRSLSKMVFNTEYLANLLRIVWYDYMKMWEWLIGVEHDVYHRVIYFLLYLNYEKLYEVVDLWWCCWYWCEYAKCRLLMVNLYMLNVNIGYGECMYWIMLLISYMQIWWW